MKLERLETAWNRYWFADGSPYDLAAARIFIPLTGLWLLLSRDLAGMATIPAEFWAATPTTVRWRYLLVPGMPVVERVVEGAAILFLTATALGVRPRLSAGFAAVLLYHLAPLEMAIHSAAPDTRGFSVTILCLVVLAVAPCGEVWQVRWRSSHVPPAAASPRFHWPLCLMQIFVAQVYFFAGWAKLVWGGIGWVSADNMRGWMLRQIQYDDMMFTAFPNALVELGAPLFFMALGTVLFELSFPLALFWKRSRRVFVPLAFSFHIGILVGMNFFYLGIPTLLVYVNWDWLRGTWPFRRKRDGTTAPA